MRKLHKKPLIMAAATLALTGTLAVGSAMAYFTTYSTAGGGVKMNMGFTRNQFQMNKSNQMENTLQSPTLVNMTAS